MEIKTSTTQMRADSQEIRDLATQYNTLQKNVFDSGRKLDAMWEGDANERFTQRMAADEPRFDELFAVINSYCQAADDSAGDYDRTEAKVQEHMGQNQVRQSR